MAVAAEFQRTMRWVLASATMMPSRIISKSLPNPTSSGCTALTLSLQTGKRPFSVNAENIPASQGTHKTLALPAAPIHRDAESTISRKPSLPYARRSFGICQSPPRVGKHYQNYDEDSHYLRYCDNGLQCGAWRKDYPRRSQKEVECTNNDGSPVAPWFEHP